MKLIGICGSQHDPTHEYHTMKYASDLPIWANQQPSPIPFPSQNLISLNPAQIELRLVKFNGLTGL